MHRDIAIVTQPGGKTVTERHTSQLVDILTELGDVTVVTANCGDDYLPNTNVIQYTENGTGGAISTQAHRYWLNQLRLTRLIKHLDADTVVFFGTQMYTLPVVATSVVDRDVDVIVLPRGDVPGSIYHDWTDRDELPRWLAATITRVLRGMEHTSYHAANQVACYSDGVADDLGLERYHAKLSTNAARYIDTNRFAPVSGHTPPARVGYVGRIATEKDIDGLIAAAKRLPENVEFRFIGDGPLRERVERELARELEEGTVSVTGWLDPHGVAAELRDCRVVLHLSKTESLSTSVLEALSTGTPVVASDVGGLSDVVRDGETGYVVDSIEDAVHRAGVLATSPQRAQEMGSAGRALVLRHYSFQGAIERWRDILTDTHGTPIEPAAAPSERDADSTDTTTETVTEPSINPNP